MALRILKSSKLHCKLYHNYLELVSNKVLFKVLTTRRIRDKLALRSLVSLVRLGNCLI